MVLPAVQRGTVVPHQQPDRLRGDFLELHATPRRGLIHVALCLDSLWAYRPGRPVGGVPMAAGDPLLTLTKVDKHFGGLHVITDFDFEVRRGRDRGPYRPERRRQVDRVQPHRVHIPGRQRQYPVQGKGDRRSRSAQDLSPGDIEDLPACPRLPQDVGLRQRHDGRCLRRQALSEPQAARPGSPRPCGVIRPSGISRLRT